MSSYITKVKYINTSIPNASAGKVNEFVDTDGVTKSKDESGTIVAYSGSAAVTAHEAATDPHPQYLTSTEGNAAYAPLAHVGTGGSAHAQATTSVAGFLSATDKTKLDSITIDTTIKSGTLSAGSFTGSPRISVVTFSSAMPSINYSIAVCGANSRSWSFQSKTVNGFTINANANAALSGEVTWICISHGEVIK